MSIKSKKNETTDLTCETNYSYCCETASKCVERIFSKILEHYFITKSNNTGETISACRLDDIYSTLCNYYGVDEKDTEYREYGNEK